MEVKADLPFSNLLLSSSSYFERRSERPSRKTSGFMSNVANSISKFKMPKFNSARLNAALGIILAYLLCVRLHYFLTSRYGERLDEESLDGLFSSSIVDRAVVNQSIGKLFPLNSLFKIDLRNASNQSQEQSFQVYSHQMSQFRQVLDEAYKSNGMVYKQCPKVPLTLQGFLNATLVLNQANLTNLVEFYENSKPLVKKNSSKNSNDTQYSNSYIDFNVNKEFWLLWNSVSKIKHNYKRSLNFFKVKLRNIKKIYDRVGILT